MKVIYIAGKVTGLSVDEARALFDKPTAYLRKEGHTVINPMELIEDPKTEWHSAMKTCIAALVKVDAVLLLDNWEYSEGATFEKEIAERLTIPTYTSAWLMNQHLKSLK
jgi:Domain of unknown function (DUF4406)